MKNLFAILIILLSVLSSYEQKSKNLYLKIDSEFVSITLDEQKFPGFLSVVKSIEKYQNGTPVKTNELHLVGYFKKIKKVK